MSNDMNSYYAVAASDPIRVLIADDHAMFRAGLRATLEDQGGISCVAEVTNGRAAVDEILRLQPEVAFLDVRMPKLDGISATRTLSNARCPTKILILTTYDDDNALRLALSAGASGFLLKSLPAEELLSAIKIVARGDTMIDPSLMRRLTPRLAESLLPDPAPPREALQLTAREHDVLLLIAEALNNIEISERLGIGEQTVKTHVSRILSKLGFRDRIQAAVYVHKNNLADPAPRATTSPGHDRWD